MTITNPTAPITAGIEKFFLEIKVIGAVQVAG
jgi:hypothetical protein